MYHPGFYPYRRFRPSRLLWFILGGTAATLFIKHREMGSCEDRFRYCRRAQIQAPPSLQQGRDGAIAASPVNATAQNRFPPQRDQAWNVGEQQKIQQWDEEKDRLLALGRQAGDTVSDLSEATLDSVQSLVESLKAKLIEHRIQRERQEKYLEGQLKEEQRNSRRLV